MRGEYTRALWLRGNEKRHLRRNPPEPESITRSKQNGVLYFLPTGPMRDEAAQLPHPNPTLCTKTAVWPDDRRQHRFPRKLLVRQHQAQATSVTPHLQYRAGLGICLSCAAS